MLRAKRAVLASRRKLPDRQTPCKHGNSHQRSGTVQDRSLRDDDHTFGMVRGRSVLKDGCASRIQERNPAYNLDVGVSPRRTNCWQKVWGGLIPTYETAFSDLFVGGNAPHLHSDLYWVCHRELLLHGDLYWVCHRELLLRGDLYWVCHRELLLRGDLLFSLWTIKTADCHAPHALVSWHSRQNRGSQ